MPRFADPEPLASGHELRGFDSGVSSLNDWLIKHARPAAGAGSARTYVVVDHQQERVVGYHALTAASITRESATPRVRRGMPRHPIPVVLLSRLAVDVTVQGKGVGAFLLTDAMRRALSAAGEIGARALLVHALDDNARDFYVRWGFEASPTDPLHLSLLMKDLLPLVERAAIPGDD